MTDKKEKVVCRFAPSPTGFLHVGGVRSALFNYLFARQHGGKLILRIEDTDAERSKKEYEKDIVEGFKWLSLEFDETVLQSSRSKTHNKYLKELLEKGVAYVSKESETKEGRPNANAGQRRSEVIRFKNPNRRVAFDDLIKGRVEFDTTELGDFVIAKSEHEPIFHFANVIDDADMGVTHVIRGEEHISNTPRQILIWEAIGVKPPIYAHIPLILASDRSKLSKRKHGQSVSLAYYRERGYLPEAMLNYLSLLGWNPGTEQELFTKDELVREFRLEKVQKGGAIFSLEKLNWMNREYLMKLPTKEMETVIKTSTAGLGRLTPLRDWQHSRLASVLRDRIHYYAEVKEIVERGELDYLVAVPVYQKQSLLWNKQPDAKKTREHLERLVKELSVLKEQPKPEEVKSIVFPYAEAVGKGEVLWPLRFALSGQEKSMDPFNLIAILGKTESLTRITNALHLLE